LYLSSGYQKRIEASGGRSPIKPITIEIIQNPPLSQKMRPLKTQVEEIYNRFGCRRSCREGGDP
jgi:hypothetical protein